jgi:HSP20 family molecular chaperone IbpA
MSCGLHAYVRIKRRATRCIQAGICTRSTPTQRRCMTTPHGCLAGVISQDLVRTISAWTSVLGGADLILQKTFRNQRIQKCFARQFVQLPQSTGVGLDDLRRFTDVFDRQVNRWRSGAAVSGSPVDTSVSSVDDGYRVRIPLPGLAPETVTVDVAGPHVHVRAIERDGDPETMRYEEVLTLPASVDTEKIGATFRYGLLELTVPYPEAGEWGVDRGRAGRHRLRHERRRRRDVSRERLARRRRGPTARSLCTATGRRRASTGSRPV